MKTKCILLLAASRFAASAQVSVFYEATVLDGTNAASGTFDMKFTLYAESNGGEPIGCLHQCIASRYEWAGPDFAGM